MSEYDNQEEYTSDFIECPLCSAHAIHERITHEQMHEPSKRETHMWVCGECPFIGFEFWHDVNAHDVVARLVTKK